MIVARATLDDLDAIEALEREGFGASGWSADAWRDEIEGGDRHVLVARSAAAGEVIGVATFQAVQDVADLHRVVVGADRRGHGIGRRLVVAGIDWATAVGAERVLLEVEHDNQPAVHLYGALGFEPISRRPDYYGQGRHALVMELDVTSAQWRSIA